MTTEEFDKIIKYIDNISIEYGIRIEELERQVIELRHGILYGELAE